MWASIELINLCYTAGINGFRSIWKWPPDLTTLVQTSTMPR